jgi:cell division protein FtsQ
MVWTVALLAVIAAAGMWLRDSQLVAVQRVTVTGLTGADAVPVTRALDRAARDMTTLHVRTEQLQAVARPYPIVKGLRVHTDFPHGLRIEVEANTPVAAVTVDGDATPVGADGRLLRGAEHGPLPLVPLRAAPGDHVADRDAAEAIAAVAAAPRPLQQRIDRAVVTREHGLVLDLRDGPELRFGGDDRLAAKWAATAAVLADPGSAGATYVDVRYPERPAAGGLEDPATQGDPSALPQAAAPTTVVPSGTIPGTAP